MGRLGMTNDELDALSDTFDDFLNDAVSDGADRGDIVSVLTIRLGDALFEMSGNDPEKLSAAMNMSFQTIAYNLASRLRAKMGNEVVN